MKIIVEEVGENEEWGLHIGATKHEPEEISYEEFHSIVDNVMYLVFEKVMKVKKR